MRILLACLLATASFSVVTPASAEFANNDWCVVHDGHHHCPDVCLPEGGSLVGCNEGAVQRECRGEQCDVLPE